METVHLLKTYKEPSGVKRYCCSRCMVDLSPWTTLSYTSINLLATCVGKGVHFGITECHEQEEVNKSTRVGFYIKQILARIFLEKGV